MNVPEELRYSTDHEWVRLVDGDTAVVGITDYAQDALGDVVYVEAPPLDSRVESGESFGEVESTKSVSDLVAPVSGTVIAVNDALDATPEMVNNDPYGDGWICRIRIDDPSHLESLLGAADYRKHTEG